MAISGFKYGDKTIIDNIHFGIVSNTLGDKIQTVEYEAYIDSRICPNAEDAYREALKLLGEESVIELLGKKYKCIMTDIYLDTSKWELRMRFTGSRIICE